MTVPVGIAAALVVVDVVVADFVPVCACADARTVVVNAARDRTEVSVR